MTSTIGWGVTTLTAVVGFDTHAVERESAVVQHDVLDGATEYTVRPVRPRTRSLSALLGAFGDAVLLEERLAAGLPVTVTDVTAGISGVYRATGRVRRRRLVGGRWTVEAEVTG